MADATERADEIGEASVDGGFAPDAQTTLPPGSATFAAKAKDLQALRDAVVDAASVGAGLWLSYLFVFFYLAIAAGGVTHRDMFFENPVKLPFLNVDLPLIGFFVLGPALFLIVHAYTLLHFVLLAGKVGAFHTELQEQIPDEDARVRLRRQLPSNIFVQFLAGPREVRTGAMGFMLRLIALISLVAGPIALLAFFQLQFLPYHDAAISWWQRLTVVADLALLWFFWPSVARGTATFLSWRDFRSGKVAACLLASVLPMLLVFTIATFPGEWLEEHLPPMRLVPTSWRLVEWASPHELLIAGGINDVGQRPGSLWSNRLVLPGIDVHELIKFDSETKIGAAPTTVSLRGRRLEGAVLPRAILPKADFTGAQLTRAELSYADLREAKFECAATDPQQSVSEQKCADLQGASLYRAQLQGARLDGAQLKGASLGRAQLQGAVLASALLKGASLEHAQLQGADLIEVEAADASLDMAQLQGASLDRAQLQGASLDRAQLQGASFHMAQLQGASLKDAQLQGASLQEAQLQGARLDGAQLQNARLDNAGLQGARLGSAQLQGASLDHVFVWRADAPEMNAEGPRIIAPETTPMSPDDFAGLKQSIEELDGNHRKDALARIERLDPNLKVEWKSDLWVALEHSSSPAKDYNKTLAGILRHTGCDARGAPYVIRGLLGKLIDGFSSDPSQAAALATDFLDEAHCPGAHGLSEEDKSALREIRDSAAPSLVSTPTSAKP